MKKSFQIKQKVKRVRREVWINNNGDWNELRMWMVVFIFLLWGGEGENGCVCVRREVS